MNHPSLKLSALYTGIPNVKLAAQLLRKVEVNDDGENEAKLSSKFGIKHTMANGKVHSLAMSNNGNVNFSSS